MKTLIKYVVCGAMIAFISPVYAGATNPETRADKEFTLMADKGFKTASEKYFAGKDQAAFDAGIQACISKLEVLQRYTLRDNTYSVPTHDHEKTFPLSKDFGSVKITYTLKTDTYLCQGVK